MTNPIEASQSTIGQIVQKAVYTLLATVMWVSPLVLLAEPAWGIDEVSDGAVGG